MWISKKKWDNLKNELSAYEDFKSIIDNIQHCNLYFYSNLAVMKIESYDKLTIKLNDSELVLKQMEEKLKEYQQLYIEEQHRRLELAEMVRKMEGD